MKVREVMTTGVVSVAPGTPFKDVVEELVRANVSGVPVVGDDGKLVGLITEADLITKPAYGGRRRRALALLADLVAARDHRWATKAMGSEARDLMTHNLAVCAPGDDIRAVARRMLGAGVKRMPVVDRSGSLVGIVSRQDILRAFDRPDEAIAADLDALLSDALRMPDDHHVTAAVRHGVVTLKGDVQHPWDADLVVDVVNGVPGVVDVVTHLRHREPNPRPVSERLP
jgi:CBS domain-containing protein